MVTAPIRGSVREPETSWVSTKPGAIALTRMPCWISSLATVRVKARMPPFAAERFRGAERPVLGDHEPPAAARQVEDDAALAEQVARLADQVDQRQAVDDHRLAQLLGVELEQRPVDRLGGAVDELVEVVGVLAHHRDHLLHPLDLADVRLDQVRRAARGRDRRLGLRRRLVVGVVVDEDVVAVDGEAFGDRAPEPARPPGHQDCHTRTVPDGRPRAQPPSRPPL
jgi:hypothetical protein